MMDGSMFFGMGIWGLLVLVLVILAIAALVNICVGRPGHSHRMPPGRKGATNVGGCLSCRLWPEPAPCPVDVGGCGAAKELP